MFDGQNEVSIQNLCTREFVKVIFTNDKEWYIFGAPWRQYNAIDVITQPQLAHKITI